MDSPFPVRSHKATPEFLMGGGELGQMIRDYDWSKTSLGPVDEWPQSLRTCIRIMLTSRQPIWIGWGKELIKFYNDPYKAIVGGKHPWALGTQASVVWKDIWKEIGPMLSKVMDKDEGTYVESQLLIMERNGYPEETYYTFSYTPIPGDDGKTAGMFCANTDDTDRIISERQLLTLTLLAKRLSECKSNNEIIKNAIDTLYENQYDFPFVLFRIIEDKKAKLVYSSPLEESKAFVPLEVSLENDNLIAPVIKKAIEKENIAVFEGLVEKLGNMPKGAWDISPDKAIVIPIMQSGVKEPFGILIVGLNPFRLLDEKYKAFFNLVADQISTTLADVHAWEVEMKRSEALAEIDRTKTTFFSNISHEFRTPLTLLLGPIEDALNDPSINEENRYRMDVAFRNAIRMQKLVNTLLEFSRIEAGRLEGQFSPVDLCQITKDLTSSFRSAVEKAGMELQFNCKPLESVVYVDMEMWERIVLNLISNAFKYTREGKISVFIQQVNDHIELVVSDTGIGIPKEHIDKIFDRFHRIENSHGRSQEGTGIGLAMVKELVKLHHGKITVSSTEGKGSVFTVSIPTGKDHLPVNKIVEKVRSILSSKNVDTYIQEAEKWDIDLFENGYPGIDGMDNFTIPENGNPDKPKIILADDNADMRNYVKNLLSHQYHVITAFNGNDALQKMKQSKPELLISDIMMPVMDGFELLTEVRKHPDLKSIPVIFLSARAGEESKVEGLDAGADDYLVKPFSARELIVRVNNLIRINHVRRETEQEFYQLFMQAPAIINVFRGPDFRYILYHPSNKKFLGDKDFTGMSLKEALPELEGQGIFEMLNEVLHEGKTIYQNERLVRFKNKEGELEDHYFNFIYQPWYDLKGKIQGVLNFAIDVTETVSIRKKVEESEAYFRRMIDTIPATIWITDAHGIFTYFNKSFQEFTGQPVEQSLGDGWFYSIHPEDESYARRIFKQATISKTPFHFLLRVHYKNDQYRWMLSNGRPRFDKEGRFEGLIGSLIDVHEQKLAEEKIRESEVQFRTLTETLPQLIWVTDPDGKQLYASSRWKEFTGREPSTDEWLRTVHPDELESLMDKWKNSLMTGENYKIEVRLKSKTGEYRWFYGGGEPVKNEESKIISWIGSFTDISEQKEIEKNLEGVVNNRTQELQRSNEDLQQFAHVASHDLKEPLRKIKTFSNRILQEYENGLPAKVKTYLHKIESASDRLFSMVNGVLNYSSISANDQIIELVDLNQVINNVENDLELLIQQNNVRINVEKLPTVEGAAVLFYQLFYNLVNNSIKFARADLPPVISIQRIPDASEKMITLVLKDNGIGFEQEFSDKIFEIFARLHSKDKYEGTGLGLALCRKIIQRHGGSISAEGMPGEGSVFTMRIPINQDKKYI